MSAQEAIAEAERLLPGVAAPEGEKDPRWQAIIHLAGFIETDSDAIWQFIQRWGCHEDRDLRSAVATCLLEHLLEHRFVDYFPKVEQLARAHSLFADTLLMCWEFGQALEPQNAALLDRLQRELGRPTD